MLTVMQLQQLIHMHSHEAHYTQFAKKDTSHDTNMHAWHCGQLNQCNFASTLRGFLEATALSCSLLQDNRRSKRFKDSAARLGFSDVKAHPLLSPFPSFHHLLSKLSRLRFWRRLDLIFPIVQIVFCFPAPSAGRLFFFYTKQYMK